MGRRLTNAEAEIEAERLRTAIRAGEFPQQPKVLAAKPQPGAPSTFRQFADVWSARRGYQLVRPRDNDYRLKLICEFVLSGTEPPMTFGRKPVGEITTGDIEACRHHRRTQRRSPVTINHDLKLLCKMFAWGIRERLLTATPFKVGSENVIRLDPESPRESDSRPRRRNETCSMQPTRIFEAY